MRRNPFLFVVLCLIVLGAFFFRYLAPERTSRIVQVAEQGKQGDDTAPQVTDSTPEMKIQVEEEQLKEEKVQLEEVLKEHQQQSVATIEKEQPAQSDSEIDLAMERANTLLQNAMKAAKEAREQIAIAQRELDQLSEARAGLDLSKIKKIEKKAEEKIERNDVKKRDTEVTPQAPASQIERVLTENTVRFNWTKSQLTDEALANIENVSRVLKYNPNISVLITGHTDSNGTEELNSWLGLIRARKVRDQLIASGINKKRIAVSSRGSKDPIDTNDTPEGRWKNRRVEFSLSEK